MKKKGVYLTEREARYLASLIKIEGGMAVDEYFWRQALRDKLRGTRGPRKFGAAGRWPFSRLIALLRRKFL